MNNSRHQPWRGRNRNPNSQNPSNSYVRQDSQTRYSSHSNLQETSYSSSSGQNVYSSTQNVSYNQAIRSFSGGQESDESRRFPSLNEQRSEARQNNYRPRRNYNSRSNYRGGKGYYNPNPKRRPRDTNGSDSESVSSNESQSKGRNRYSESENQVNSFPQRIKGCGYSEDEYNSNSYQNSFADRNPTNYYGGLKRSPSIERKPNINFSNQPELVNSANPNIETEYNGSNKYSANSFGAINANETFSTYENDKLAALRNYKQNFEQILKNLDPTELIMDCREHINKLNTEAVSQNYKYISLMKTRLSENNNSKALQLHLENLLKQQKEFEATTANVKGQLSSILASDIHDLLKSTEHIKEEFQNECRLFKRSMPAYGFKGEILNMIKENQVTIISSDAPYFLNILLPVFVKKEFKNHYLVCCETSEMLCARLKRNVFHFLYNKDDMDEVDEKKLANSIRFMVVEDILNLFSNDYTVDEKNMFVILNLPLKRSLNLDIVLANLKDMLENHEEARVVLLLSHCDYPKKYENYFADLGEVPIFPLPNLTLPVKTIWKSLGLLPTDDYIEEVVKTALAIHTLNDAGDILAFLPTQTEIKSVSVKLKQKLSAFRYADFDCVILHETTTSKYGLDLFGKKKSSNRTVFLATDCAEMLVIPTVCYVIDCGLKKENMFDVQKKLDVLTTTFISRDKCKLRKTLSGAFNEGVCYRLYNKENFCKEMPSCEYPEILTVNPFNSMIKVFQHRPQSATTVEFVESLPKVTKENALKLLKKYNAVKDNTLTELGKNIVKLPYPAKYSKLILLGIQWGYTFEAVVLVAFFSVKGRVFDYSQNPESQKLIDAVKLQLVQNDSDTLSYLYIYKTWIENNSNLLWCTQHRINFDTLVNVQAKVDEICRIVGESLKENISQEFSTAKDSSTSLLEMLFECFQDNLCVFTGHYKSGYRVLSSRCIAFLHPSSIICQMENLPQFIIFDHMLPSSRDFLVTITAIPSDLVMQGLNDLTIDFDYSDMFEKSLVQKVIDPVGERMIKQVLLGKKGQKLKLIEEQIKKQLSTTSLVIEPMPNKGQVHVYALESQIDQAVKFVNEILKSQFEEIVNSEKTVILELKRGQVKVSLEVKWAKGANIVSIKTGSCDKTGVTIQNILDDEDENPSDVSPAVIQQSINLTWTRRRCNGQGFINVKSADFNRARRLAMRQFAFMGSEFFVHISKKEPNQLYLTGIPPEAKNWELEEAFKHILPNIDLERVELRYTEPFETSQNAMQEMKVKIEEMCREHTNLVDFSIVIPQPKNTATIMKAYINVPNEEDIDPASIQLSKCKMGEATIISKTVYRSIIKCKIEVCEALKESFLTTLNNLQEKLREEYIDEEALFEFDINRISDASDIAAIKMLSNHREILETLQRAVNELLEGQVLNKMFNNKLGKIFCHGGHMWLHNLEKTCSVHIVEDYITKSLRLYGSEDNCYIAKNRIHQFLEDTENEVVKSFPLSVKGNRKLLKAVIIEYGANLEKFIESCELQSATLDIRSCLLTVHGNRDSLEKAEDALSELSVGLDSSGFSEVLNNEERCPVCDSSALNLTIRLELCGHLYCSECIQGLVDQAQFPLKCCASDCEKDIVLDDISKVLGDDAEKMRELLHKAMNHYIKDHQAEIFNCPAPDCTMFFYKKDLTGNKINCPLCQNDICRQCNAVFHQGLSCDMYQGSKIDADYSFKAWQKTTTQCKQCPRCKTAIEKISGCNRMICTSCKAPFCWICITEFRTEHEVYSHIDSAHTGRLFEA